MINSKWLTLSETVMIEYQQSYDEGRDVAVYEQEALAIDECFNNGCLMEEKAAELLEKIKNAPMREGYAYVEPSDLASIRKMRKNHKPAISKTADMNKIYGAWLGRCVGCLLGQPVEGWYRERILGLLKDTGNYPIKNYMSSDIDKAIRERYKVVDEGRVYGSNHINWINNVSFMPEDDDTNYTVMNMKTVEEYGLDFTPVEMSHSWMMNMQFMHACTAERVAYRNFVNMIEPPYSALYNNAYREWIGAQIRADLFGYVCPGNPERAAELAWKDGCISHTKNGVYGEMMVAAMLARAAVSDDMDDIIAAGIGEIPSSSRLYGAVKTVLGWYADGISAEDAILRIHEEYDEKNPHHWCHTISNAMICIVALLWGGKDLEKTVGIAVAAGFDTDCNGATTGSIVGMIVGAKALPAKWVEPLDDTIISGIDGFGKVRISELAARTVDLIR